MHIIYGHSTNNITWVVDATENEVEAYTIADTAKADQPQHSYTVEKIR